MLPCRVRAAAIAFCLGFCGSLQAAKSDVQLVFLQGTSASDIADLVEGVGGVVTHDLHLIKAVGAKLLPEQLETVLESPLISRHIGDLSDTERPEGEEEAESGCKVRGHIELDFSPAGFSWPVYNKRAEPALLKELEISWPPDLGELEAISFGESSLPASLFAEGTAGSVKLVIPADMRPVVADRVYLKVSFRASEDAVHASHLRQHDFKIDASFEGDCSTDLVPGYERNHEDYYYNSVAGVDSLHLLGITGKGVTVAVVDSGLWDHPALTRDTEGKDRVLARYDALKDVVGEAFDESGHGTHMSSIILNSEPTLRDGQPTGSYRGVAPDARLVAVKVLDREGLAHVLEIVRAIQWVVVNKHKYDIRVLNLSFAQTPRWSYWEDPVNQSVMMAWAEGIAVVAAAGNDGPEPETIGAPGNVPYIITVGAVTDSWTPDTRDDDYIPDFSSQGPTPEGHVKPDVVALGGHMTGLIDPESALALDQPEDILRTGEFVSTGSSQASALVSGILALLLQLEPDLTPDDLKCKLITSAEPAINRDGKLAYSPFQQGFGYVTANRAVLFGQKGCGNPGLDLTADIKNEKNFLGPAMVGEDGRPVLPWLKGMVSEEPSEPGLSENRKWGVKDHMERVDSPGPRKDFPIDWEVLYLLERSIVDKYSREALADPLH